MDVALLSRKRSYPDSARKQVAGKRRYNVGGRPMYYPIPDMIMAKRRNIVKYQQTHFGGEIKSIDVVNAATPTANTLASWALNQTPTIQVINLVTIGSSMWNRVGRKISMRSLRLRGHIAATTNNASPVVPPYGRVVVVYDKQTNGSLPAASGLFRDQASVAADSNLTNWLSGINLNNRERFEVIWDKQFALPAANTSGVGGTAGVVTATADCMHFDWFINLRGRETHFQADSSPAVIGDIASGSLVMITMGNIVAASEPWALSAAIRMRYSDL